MASTIKLKRSSTAGAIPSISDLALGELAVNSADGKVYMRTYDDEIIEVGGGGMPIGAIYWYSADTPPDGSLVCDGGAVTTLYPDLRQHLIDIGSPWGTDGNGDPLKPNLLGEFVRGWDGGRGVDSGRVFGSWQDEDVGPHTHDFTGRSLDVGGGSSIDLQGGGTDSPTYSDPVGSVSAPAGTETRPRNVALLPCIKAYSNVSTAGAADLAELLAAIATEAEAQAGTNNQKIMTPLRTAQSLAAIQTAVRSVVADDGTISSGTYTPTPAGGNSRKIVNGGAFTLAAEAASDSYTMVVKITNGASAGTITMSGFDVVDGDSLTTTNGDAFLVYITNFDGSAIASVRALQ